jgi:hypothetical protein
VMIVVRQYKELSSQYFLPTVGLSTNVFGISLFLSVCLSLCIAFIPAPGSPSSVRLFIYSWKNKETETSRRATRNPKSFATARLEKLADAILRFARNLAGTLTTCFVAMLITTKDETVAAGTLIAAISMPFACILLIVRGYAAFQKKANVHLVVAALASRAPALTLLARTALQAAELALRVTAAKDSIARATVLAQLRESASEKKRSVPWAAAAAVNSRARGASTLLVRTAFERVVAAPRTASTAAVALRARTVHVTPALEVVVVAPRTVWAAAKDSIA